MKFKDVKEHTWVKYLGDYFFVGYVDDYECYLENELDVITLTADDFKTYHIEPEHEAFPYGLDMGHKYVRAWSTPFQIRKLDY